MLLIAIVDDERSDSSALKALVDTYFQQNRQAYMIHVFNGALDFIRSTENHDIVFMDCLLYTSPSPRDRSLSRMPSSA